MYCLFKTHGFPDIKFPDTLAILTIQEFDILLCNFGYRLLYNDPVTPLFDIGTEQDSAKYTNGKYWINACLLPDDWCSHIPEHCDGIVEHLSSTEHTEEGQVDTPVTFKFSTPQDAPWLAKIHFKHIMNQTQSLIALGYNYLDTVSGRKSRKKLSAGLHDHGFTKAEREEVQKAWTALGGTCDLFKEI